MLSRLFGLSGVLSNMHSEPGIHGRENGSSPPYRVANIMNGAGNIYGEGYGGGLDIKDTKENADEEYGYGW